MAIKKFYLTGGSVIPQSDWNQTDETQLDYIKNKPSITEELVANALKGTASGTAVSMTDVSPLEHEIGVKLSADEKLVLLENLYSEWPADTKGGDYRVVGKNYDAAYDKTVFELENGVIIYSSTEDDLPLETGDVIRMKTVAQDEEEKWSFSLVEKTDFPSVTLTKYGKNLVDINQMLNECLADNGDGTFTLTRSSSSFVSKISPVNIQAGTAIRCSIEILENNLTNGGFYGRAEFADGTYEGFGFNRTLTFEKNIVGFVLYVTASVAVGGNVAFKNFQIELGTTATEYEPFKEPASYTPTPGGTVEGVTSLYPSTTLLTDTEGIIITAEYNRDLNKVIESLVNAIISLGGNV